MFKVYNGEPEFEELAQEFDAGGSAMSIRGFPDVYNPKFRKIMEFLRTDKEFIRECRAHEQYYIRASMGCYQDTEYGSVKQNEE